MPPFAEAACGGLEDFGFEVSENGKIFFVMDENEWKDDADEWMQFFHREFDFLDKRGRKRNIPTAYLIKSSRKISKSFEVAHHREGLGNKRPGTSQIPAVQKEFSGFAFISLRNSHDSNDSAGSSSRYGRIGPIDSEELITVKGLSRNNMRRSFPDNQPVPVMNTFNRSSKNVMSTGLLKQKKSVLKAAALTITSTSSRSSSSVFKRLGRRG